MTKVLTLTRGKRLTVHDLTAQPVKILVAPFIARLHDGVDEAVDFFDGHVCEQLVPIRMPFDGEYHEIVSAASSPAGRTNMMYVQPFTLDPEPALTAHVPSSQVQRVTVTRYMFHIPTPEQNSGAFSMNPSFTLRGGKMSLTSRRSRQGFDERLISQ